MFGFAIYPWKLYDRQIGWAALRPSADPLDFEVLRFWEYREPEECRVYWGSHGCDLPRGHFGPHRCSCAEDPDIDPETREHRSEPGVFNVGAPPYYGPETHFYGEDA